MPALALSAMTALFGECVAGTPAVVGRTETGLATRTVKSAPAMDPALARDWLARFAR